MMTNEGVESIYMTRNECALMHSSLKEAINSNTSKLDELNKTIKGNGEDGLILTVNKLMWRSQLLDKGTSILIAIITSIVTIYLQGWIMRLLG
jgi:hypothetical protein